MTRARFLFEARAIQTARTSRQITSREHARRFEMRVSIKICAGLNWESGSTDK
jgi:hypothetical protein